MKAGTGTEISKLPFKPVAGAYLDFKKLRPDESLKSFESARAASCLAMKEGLSRSAESANAKELMRGFINGVITFIQETVKLIFRILFSAITFFKKLILNAMDDRYIDSCGEFYQGRRQEILEKYARYAGRCQVNAVPPKHIRSFASDNKIMLAMSQTANLLEEIDISFKQRTELWDGQNKRSADFKDSGNIFKQLAAAASNLKAGIADFAILGYLGIKLHYTVDSLSLHDPQVRDYLLALVQQAGTASGAKEALPAIFRIPKEAMNVYLFGNPRAKASMITVAEFLKHTGPGEFDKLNRNEMKKIKANAVMVEGIVKKMELTAEKLQKSGAKFMESLKDNSSRLLNNKIISHAEESFDNVCQWITPLLSVSSSLYSYFSTVIVEYGLRYCLHRKALAEAAVLLVNQKE
jgi:hypothetical protein